MPGLLPHIPLAGTISRSSHLLFYVLAHAGSWLCESGDNKGDHATAGVGESVSGLKGVRVEST